METKQSIFFLIQLFVFSPLSCVPYVVSFSGLSFLLLPLKYSTMFIYKIIEANCPFRLEQCLSSPRVPNFHFFFIGGNITFTVGSWSSLLRRIPDKKDHCVFTRGSRGGVMTCFEKNKVLGVEPNKRTPWTHSESNIATNKKKVEVRNSRGFSFEVRKIPPRFKQH
jgi:hypothetical protein